MLTRNAKRGEEKGQTGRAPIIVLLIIAYTHRHCTTSNCKLVLWFTYRVRHIQDQHYTHRLWFCGRVFCNTCWNITSNPIDISQKMREFQKALCTTTTKLSSPGQREGLKKSMIHPPLGLQSTEIAARLRRKMTNVGCHSLPSNVQTYLPTPMPFRLNMGTMSPEIMPMWHVDWALLSLMLKIFTP